MNTKQKNLNLYQHPVCLGNISKDFLVNDMKETELNRYVYDSLAGFGSINFNITFIFINI